MHSVPPKINALARQTAAGTTRCLFHHRLLFLLLLSGLSPRRGVGEKRGRGAPRERRGRGGEPGSRDWTSSLHSGTALEPPGLGNPGGAAGAGGVGGARPVGGASRTRGRGRGGACARAARAARGELRPPRSPDSRAQGAGWLRSPPPLPPPPPEWARPGGQGDVSRGPRARPDLRDVAQARGGVAEERLEALGDSEEQLLLHPAAAPRPRRGGRPAHG